ncbi:MAG: phosphoribosylformylglycinamidine synthase [Bacteroidia bacterium]|nr:phosphoribosylformylglycinamidine synthase [Bacteroidia bacterium]
MILFFGSPQNEVFAVQVNQVLSESDTHKLSWLFGKQPKIDSGKIEHIYIGPRAAMITPWSTNAVEITRNMGITGIQRIEKFFFTQDENASFDPMISSKYNLLDQDIFTINIKPEPIGYVNDIASYNEQEGLALNKEEITYLEDLSKKLGRPLTDSEVFGFSQINSEHCRHKIFNGTFIINGEEQPTSLFKLIKKTSKENPNEIVSAYSDNVAFLKGPKAVQFAPATQNKADYYEKKMFNSVISLKAETHNFPTTVEPFNGAATGSGGEIRDRMAGGQGSIPLAGTALYMTAYPRIGSDRPWQNKVEERKWLYQTPLDILIKASNGASDFGNKFGQPLINGSLFTFEHLENNQYHGYDKVIMLAGGIGYGKEEQALKAKPKQGDKIVILGGDNYRIGMGGAAVSSADTGEFSSGIELNAVQRSNPEMQKRVSNAIRSLVELDINPIVSIHDHGAGGHLNCLSELVEETGGKIDLAKLPIGDPTLSAKEIIGNESQERMGLVIPTEQIANLKEIADRERAPIYEVGEVTDDHRFIFESSVNGDKPMDLSMDDMFGSSPKTILTDTEIEPNFGSIDYDPTLLKTYISQILKLEAVSCKDWLTNKVDRCVGGKVAKQQCVGSLQLPLNNCGVMALDYDGKSGIATSMGHAPLPSLISAEAGSRIAITEALTNIIWAPLEKGLKSVSLSANWMWPCKNPGEDSRLYKAVQSVSDFAIALGINVPTGKDSLSMKQKYPDKEVIAPGTVVISAVGHCSDINRIVEPGFKVNGGDIYYVNLTADDYQLGGSALAQVLNKVGDKVADIKNPEIVIHTFSVIQKFIKEGVINSGHDISTGGLITTLLESCFPNNNIAAEINFNDFQEKELSKILLAENAGIVFQAKSDKVQKALQALNVPCMNIGKVISGSHLHINNDTDELVLNIPTMRDEWYETSYLLDQHQTAGNLAKERYQNYKRQPLQYRFPSDFDGKTPNRPEETNRPKAAIIREKGSNSERELAHAMYLAGFDVKDIHMTDLISGRENLEDIQFLGAVGGFSNSDVLGSAKGWAGAFLYNDKAKSALDNFFAREDVLSVGICNGCQLFMELNLINPEHNLKGKMGFNDSRKHESAFTSVHVLENNAVMLSNLKGTTLGVWISHGEGKFVLPESESEYNIAAKYGYQGYPSNPNGSDYNAAMISSKNGRHLAMMPHIERSMFKWNWANYPDRDDDISPWIIAFQNAYDWCVKVNA